MKKVLIIYIATFILLSFISTDDPFASSRGLKKVKTSTGKTVELYKDSYALVIGNSKYRNGWDPLPVPDSSVFKQAFIDLIEGRDKEPIPDGYITGEELALYLRNKVPEYNRSQHPQYGKIRDPRLDKGDFVFRVSGFSEAVRKGFDTPYYGGGQQGYDDMVFVKGGCFNMGDTFGDGGAVEKPEYEVCVDDFYIGKYEVTQGQWKTVMGSNPSHFSSCGDNCPVESISWNDAKEYIRKLNRQTGKNFRLPTFTEWVYAARSGGKREKWAGTSSESELGEYAWYKDNSGNKTHTVGQKESNGLGIYDMSGNVWEWVSDWYNYKNSPENNSNRTNSVSYYVLRGGAWNYNQRMLRGRLVGFSPDFQIISSGFRIASTPRRNSGEMSREITVVPEEIKNMVFVKGGCFEMGCGDWTRVCDDDEKPVHKVCLDDYYIDIYEVTQKEYRRVIGENPSSTFENTLMASKPVDSVTWHDAKAYCEKVTKRLPTEAEWEYAARSGGKRQKYAGFSDYSEMFYYVNHCDKNCFFTANKTDQNDGYKRTAPVGSYKANELGIYDMSGNVWEWVSDWHKADYYKHSSMHNPQGPETGSERVLRGGSWLSYPKAVRSSYRNRKVPFNTNVDNGFRCARTP